MTALLIWSWASLLSLSYSRNCQCSTHILLACIHHFCACWSDGGLQCANTWDSLPKGSSSCWSSFGPHLGQATVAREFHSGEQSFIRAHGRRWLHALIPLHLVRINPRFVLYHNPQLPNGIMLLLVIVIRYLFCFPSLPHPISPPSYKGILASPSK